MGKGCFWKVTQTSDSTQFRPRLRLELQGTSMFQSPVNATDQLGTRGLAFGYDSVSSECFVCDARGAQFDAFVRIIHAHSRWVLCLPSHCCDSCNKRRNTQLPTWAPALQVYPGILLNLLTVDHVFPEGRCRGLQRQLLDSD